MMLKLPNPDDDDDEVYDSIYRTNRKPRPRKPRERFNCLFFIPLLVLKSRKKSTVQNRRGSRIGLSIYRELHCRTCPGPIFVAHKRFGLSSHGYKCRENKTYKPRDYRQIEGHGGNKLTFQKKTNDNRQSIRKVSTDMLWKLLPNTSVTQDKSRRAVTNPSNIEGLVVTRVAQIYNSDSSDIEVLEPSEKNTDEKSMKQLASSALFQPEIWLCGNLNLKIRNSPKLDTSGKLDAYVVSPKQTPNRSLNSIQKVLKDTQITIAISPSSDHDSTNSKSIAYNSKSLHPKTALYDKGITNVSTLDNSMRSGIRNISNNKGAVMDKNPIFAKNTNTLNVITNAKSPLVGKNLNHSFNLPLFNGLNSLSTSITSHAKSPIVVRNPNNFINSLPFSGLKRPNKRITTHTKSPLVVKNPNNAINSLFNGVNSPNTSITSHTNRQLVGKDSINSIKSPHTSSLVSAQFDKLFNSINQKRINSSLKSQSRNVKKFNLGDISVTEGSTSVQSTRNTSTKDSSNHISTRVETEIDMKINKESEMAVIDELKGTISKDNKSVGFLFYPKKIPGYLKPVKTTSPVDSVIEDFVPYGRKNRSVEHPTNLNPIINLSNITTPVRYNSHVTTKKKPSEQDYIAAIVDPDRTKNRSVEYTTNPILNSAYSIHNIIQVNSNSPDSSRDKTSNTEAISVIRNSIPTIRRVGSFEHPIVNSKLMYSDKPSRNSNLEYFSNKKSKLNNISLESTPSSGKKRKLDYISVESTPKSGKNSKLNHISVESTPTSRNDSRTVNIEKETSISPITSRPNRPATPKRLLAATRYSPAVDTSSSMAKKLAVIKDSLTSLLNTNSETGDDIIVDEDIEADIIIDEIIDSSDTNKLKRKSMRDLSSNASNIVSKQMRLEQDTSESSIIKEMSPSKIGHERNHTKTSLSQEEWRDVLRMSNTNKVSKDKAVVKAVMDVEINQDCTDKEESLNRSITEEDIQEEWRNVLQISNERKESQDKTAVQEVIDDEINKDEYESLNKSISEEEWRNVLMCVGNKTKTIKPVILKESARVEMLSKTIDDENESFSLEEGTVNNETHVEGVFEEIDEDDIEILGSSLEDSGYGDEIRQAENSVVKSLRKALDNYATPPNSDLVTLSDDEEIIVEKNCTKNDESAQSNVSNMDKDLEMLSVSDDEILSEEPEKLKSPVLALVKFWSRKARRDRSNLTSKEDVDIVECF